MTKPNIRMPIPIDCSLRETMRFPAPAGARTAARADVPANPTETQTEPKRKLFTITSICLAA